MSVAWSGNVSSGTKWKSSNPVQIQQSDVFQQGEKYEFTMPQASFTVALDPNFRGSPPGTPIPTADDFKRLAQYQAQSIINMFRKAIEDQQGIHVKVLFQSFDYQVIDKTMEPPPSYIWHVELNGTITLQVQDIGFVFTPLIIIAIAIGLGILIASIATSVSVYHLVAAAAEAAGGLGGVVVLLGVVVVAGLVAYVVLSSPKSRAHVKQLGKRAYHAARRRLT